VGEILEQTIDDEEKFFIEYTVDDGDDWTSDIALVKANPNIDISVAADFLRSRQKEAIQNAREQGRFKTKHLNLWVQSRSAAFNIQRWNSGYDPTLDIADFAGRKARLGLDLASEVDIAALELVIEDDDGGFVEFGKYYLPEEKVSDPKNSHYHAWQAAGEIIVTDGARIDFGRIEDDILALAEIFPNLEVGFDPYQANYLATRLSDRGISCVKFPQQVATMSPAMKRLDALILSGKMRHKHSPSSPMTWMISNVVAKIDAKDNIYPRKEREENKIDGPVALIMAIGRAMDGAAVQESVYETRGILTF